VIRAVAPAIPWQTATITSIVASTPRIKTFTFALMQPMTFIAGQHVDIRLTAADGYRALRSYSIASAPGDGSAIELAIERVDEGEVSAFFHDVALVGDRIELRGPLGGYFQWPHTETGPLLLIGGGSGVVPLLSMVRHRAQIGDTRPVLLLYSARNVDDVLARDELLALHARDDGFMLVFTLTRGMLGRPRDFTRRVDTGMMSNVIARLPAPPAVVFICGTNGFVNTASDGAIAAGVDPARIRTERYGG